MRMPSPNLNSVVMVGLDSKLLGHLCLATRVRFVLHRLDGLVKTQRQAFAFVVARNTDFLASLLLKANINSWIHTFLHVNHMPVWVITSSQCHCAARRNLEVELVVDTLIVIQLAELLVHVVRDVECLHGVLVVPDVPNLNGQVVPWKNVVVAGRCELGPCHRVNDVGKEVAFLRIFLCSKLEGVVGELRVTTHVAQAQVALAAGKTKQIGLPWVELDVSDNFRKFLVFFWL